MNQTQTPIDVSKLLASDDLATADHIWAVNWEAKLPADLFTEEDLHCPECGEDHDLEDLRTSGDSTTVLCGPEGQDAIDKVRAFILDPKAEFPLTDFRLVGLELLAVSEIR